MQGLNIRAARLALVAGVAFGLTAGAAIAQEKSITVQMTGAAEKPTAGDPDGTGTAVLKIDPAKTQVCYTLNVSKLAAATGAHIHKAAAGAAGPVVVPLMTPNASGMSEGCATVTREVAMALETTPADYYVNVHTADFPGGALRGQLH